LAVRAVCLKEMFWVDIDLSDIVPMSIPDESMGVMVVWNSFKQRGGELGEIT